jgi:phosphate transport system protein
MTERLDRVRHALLALAGLVEEQLRRAMHAYFAADAAGARRVTAADADVDLLETRLDETCVRALGAGALPAEELRFVVAAMSIGTALERVGDEAAAIAGSALSPYAPSDALARLARHVRGMLGDGVEAMGRLDPWLARRILADGPKARSLAESAAARLAAEPLHDSAKLAQAFHAAEAVRRLERVAGHAAGIAGMVLYASGEGVAKDEPERIAA